MVRGFEQEVIIAESAFKHGLTEDEILYALNNCLLSKTIKKPGNPNKTVDMVLGYLQNGNECELIVSQTYDEKCTFVFHAKSPATKGFLKELEKKK